MKISKHEFDYTAEEKAKIGRLEGECGKYMAKGAKEGVFDKLKNIGSDPTHPSPFLHPSHTVGKPKRLAWTC